MLYEVITGRSNGRGGFVKESLGGRWASLSAAERRHHRFERLSLRGDRRLRSSELEEPVGIRSFRDRAEEHGVRLGLGP